MLIASEIIIIDLNDRQWEMTASAKNILKGHAANPC